MSQAQVKIVGTDVFVRTDKMPALKSDADLGAFELKMISNRGTKVWPGKAPAINMTDVYSCRFMYKGSDAKVPVTELLAKLDKLGWEWVHVEKLLEINGKAGFTVAQGE